MFLFEPILPRGRMRIKRHGRGDPGFAREAVITIAVIIPDSRRRNPSFLPPFAKGSLGKRGTPLKTKTEPHGPAKNPRFTK